MCAICVHTKRPQLRVSLHDNPHKPGHHPPMQSEINVTFSCGSSAYLCLYIFIFCCVCGFDKFLCK